MIRWHARSDVLQHSVYVYKNPTWVMLVPWMAQLCMLCGMLPPQTGLVMAAPPVCSVGGSVQDVALDNASIQYANCRERAHSGHV